MFLPLTVTLVSAPGLLVFLVARSSFFTWATASIEPLNKRAPNRIRFISDVAPFSFLFPGSIQRAPRAPGSRNPGQGARENPERATTVESHPSVAKSATLGWATRPFE